MDLEKQIIQLTVELNATQKALGAIASNTGMSVDEYADLLQTYRGQEWSKIEDIDSELAARVSEGSPFD